MEPRKENRLFKFQIWTGDELKYAPLEHMKAWGDALVAAITELDDFNSMDPDLDARHASYLPEFMNFCVYLEHQRREAFRLSARVPRLVVLATFGVLSPHVEAGLARLPQSEAHTHWARMKANLDPDPRAAFFEILDEFRVQEASKDCAAAAVLFFFCQMLKRPLVRKYLGVPSQADRPELSEFLYLDIDRGGDLAREYRRVLRNVGWAKTPPPVWWSPPPEPPQACSPQEAFEPGDHGLEQPETVKQHWAWYVAAAILAIALIVMCLVSTEA